MTVKDYLLLGLNTLGSLASRLPGDVGWNNFTQTSTTNPTAADKLTPAQQLAVIQKDKKGILASIGLDIKNLPSDKGFDIYADARIKSANDFASVASISKDLTAATTSSTPATKEAATAATASIKTALDLSPDAQKAHTDFNKLMKAIHERFGKDSKLEINGQKILNIMHEAKSKAETAIKTQHAHELKELDTLFNDPTFQGNLKTSLKISDDAAVTTIKTDMVTALNASHKKELEEFNKGLDEPLKKMHESLQKERDRVFFLATLAAHSKSVNAAIHKKYYNRKTAEGKSVPVTIEAGNKNPRAIFKNITIAELETIQTATGRKLERQPDGSYHMDLPNRLFGFGYYYSSHNNLKADFMTMANAIRCNSQSITMTIKNDDEDFALKLGRAAYAACLEAGFDAKKPKNITIQVNGKTMGPDELFKDHPSELAAARANATRNADDRKKWDNEIDEPTSTDKWKKAILEGRLEEQVQEEEEERTNVPRGSI